MTYQQALAWMKQAGVRMTAPFHYTDGSDAVRVYHPSDPSVSRTEDFPNHVQGAERQREYEKAVTAACERFRTEVGGFLAANTARLR